MADYRRNKKNVCGSDITEEYTSVSVTNYISKVITTENYVTDTTFKGNEVVEYSIAPAGVAKASIDTSKSIVTFEKYDQNWTGEVVLNLETLSTDGSGEHYVHKFSINFIDSDIGLVDSSNESWNDDVEELSDEELETISAGKKASKKTTLEKKNSRKKGISKK